MPAALVYRDYPHGHDQVCIRLYSVIYSSRRSDTQRLRCGWLHCRILCVLR